MRAAWQLGAVAAVLATTWVARAQCTKDTDCKGDRVCEGGKCTSPQALPAPPPPPPGQGAPTAAPPAAAPTPPASAPQEPVRPALDAPPPPPPLAPPPARVIEEPPPPERRNRTAMVAGIVMVSAAPVALLGALVAKNAQDRCDNDIKRDYPSLELPSSERYREDDCNAYSVPLYVLAIGGGLLVAGGIPLIVYGGKTLEAPTTARLQLVPWASQTSGGVRLRLDL